MMAAPIPSDPVFIKCEDFSKFFLGNGKTTEICMCPLPITEKGSYAHIVEFNKEYRCNKCGTVIMACSGSPY